MCGESRKHGVKRGKIHPDCPGCAGIKAADYLSLSKAFALAGTHAGAHRTPSRRRATARQGRSAPTGWTAPASSTGCFITSRTARMSSDTAAGRPHSIAIVRRYHGRRRVPAISHSIPATRTSGLSAALTRTAMCGSSTAPKAPIMW